MNRDQAQDLLPIITAFAGGKDVQFRHITQKLWSDVYTPLFDGKDFEWRIKPLEFPTLPEGLEWHNPAGLTPEQIGEEFRPLVEGETVPSGYHFWSSTEKRWVSHGLQAGYQVPEVNSDTTCRVPSSTPFPEPPKKKVRVPLTESDLPGTVWIMPPNGGHLLITEFPEAGVIAWPFRASFRDLMDSGFKWSTDRKTWQPCSKEA